MYKRLPANVKECRTFYLATILIYALVYAYNIKVCLIYLTSIYFTHLMTGSPLASVPHSFAVHMYQTCTNTSAESLPEAQKSKNGYYTITQVCMSSTTN